MTKLEDGVECIWNHGLEKVEVSGLRTGGDYCLRVMHSENWVSYLKWDIQFY